jgi:GT2 family glycosyltransferase
MILPSVSIIVPVHNGGESFRLCLSSLRQCLPLATEVLTEVIIVVDGGSNESWEDAQAFAKETIAGGYQTEVLHRPTAAGPAHARNRGAQIARGDILFFIDADVTLHAETLPQVAAIFQANADLAALIGSYDDAPGSANFLSQYKNLFHHYTHQTANQSASTFWGACGAIRREAFLQMGGFDESYRYPSVEDIELGYRLKQAGYSIWLCKTVQVKHLKQWRCISLLRAEIFYRAIPWTELLWRDRQFVNDLNLKVSARTSLLLTYGLLISIFASYWWTIGIVVALAMSISLLIINKSVYRFFWRKRGFWFACCTIPWHWLYFLYSGVSFAIGTMRYRIFGNPRVVKNHALEPTPVLAYR